MWMSAQEIVSLVSVVSYFIVILFTVKMQQHVSFQLIRAHVPPLFISLHWLAASALIKALTFVDRVINSRVPLCTRTPSSRSTIPLTHCALSRKRWLVVPTPQSTVMEQTAQLCS